MALAACGLDCGDCAIFQAREHPEIAERIAAWFREERKVEVRPEQIRCPGCRGDQAEHWTPGGSILLCCQGRDLDCGDCDDFPRASPVEWSQGSTRYAEALPRLQQMRRQRC